MAALIAREYGSSYSLCFKAALVPLTPSFRYKKLLVGQSFMPYIDPENCHLLKRPLLVSGGWHIETNTT